jgi:hypothetical protein
MKIRSKIIKSRRGRILDCILDKNSGPAANNGTSTVIKIMKIIMPLNTIIRCLNFNGNTPIIKIEERYYCVNNVMGDINEKLFG